LPHSPSEPEQPDLDPYLHDPDHWGVSLAQSAELMLSCLDAAGVTSIVEIGAFAGDLTRVLVDWSSRSGASVGAIDPAPQPGLEALARDNPQLELIRQTSLEALPRIDLPDAVVIDGDHNYFTVSEELRMIAESAGEGELPLLLLHDVSWPHARRDDYFDATQIPPDARHPVAGDAGGLVPGEPGVRPGGGLPYPRSAAREGGPRNGVLTAAEDFVAGREGLRLAVVPAFFGFGVIWETAVPWASHVEQIVRPWDRNPMLTRLEENRVHHLALAQTRLVELGRTHAQEVVLRRLLNSRAFAVAEALSRLRSRVGIARGEEVVSRDDLREALGEGGR
jgi:hypothetical protein